MLTVTPTSYVSLPMAWRYVVTVALVPFAYMVLMFSGMFDQSYVPPFIFSDTATPFVVQLKVFAVTDVLGHSK